MKLIVKARELNIPGRKPLYEGDAFEIDDQSGKTLKLIGKAGDPPPEKAPPFGRIATTRPAKPGMTHETTPPDAPLALEPETTGELPAQIVSAADPEAAPRYRTRRLTAED